ncbi:MAG: nucleotidyltransferase domain-containing protein [Candidatus Magasanikbacteria bacterium]|nr:nucleotidyltransferase domain-containing protein [Candidatus Magasanikbacteria bacterium]
MVKKIYPVRQVKKFAKEFVRHLEYTGLKVESAYLFGSYAKNHARAWSDIDVCVVSKKNRRNIGWGFLLKKRRIIDVARGIEPHFFSAKDFASEADPLVYEIKRTGVKLK